MVKSCEYCKYTTKNLFNLKRHINSKHVTTCHYNCHLCNKKYKRKDKLKQHLAAAHHIGKILDNRTCIICKDIQVRRKYKIKSMDNKYLRICNLCRFNMNETPFLRRQKENICFKYIQKHIKHDIIRDKIINNGHSRKRPDGIIKLKNFSIIIECDENQHKSYVQIHDDKRIQEIYDDLGLKSLVIIRFNPDSYKVGKIKYNSIFKYNKETKLIEINNEELFNKRMDQIIKYVNKYLIKSEIDSKFKFHKLYYDNYME